MERTSESLWMRLASCGSNSETWMPETFVEIGLKAELGFGSKVSTWLGPPSSQKRIHDFALPAAGAAAEARRYCGSEMPRAPNEPADTNFRRGIIVVLLIGFC